MSDSAEASRQGVAELPRSDSTKPRVLGVISSSLLVHCPCSDPRMLSIQNSLLTLLGNLGLVVVVNLSAFVFVCLFVF